MNETNFAPKNIRLVVSDFDGIFTDRKIDIFSDGRTSKKLDYADLMGIAMILKKDIKFAIISGENSAAIDFIKSKFPIIDTFQNERHKINILNSLMEKYDVNANEIIYFGDDINDIDCLNLVGYKVTVPEAQQKVKEVENIYITKEHCGNGAFREIVNLIE